MMLGMGTVFVFLGLLVFATFGLSKLVQAMGLAGLDGAAPTSNQSELEGVAAAAAAVHRARRG